MSRKKEKTVFALGADMKSRFLVAKGGDFLFGPDIGDLSNAANFELLKKEFKSRTKGLKPDMVLCDLHPGYFSTSLSKSFNPKPIQHHYAHIGSVIGEHNLKRKVIGVSFDGTGFGLDGKIWGGEFLIADRKGFKRAAHLKYQKMPGGESVIKEPWRMAVSILGEKAFPHLRTVKKSDKEMILALLSKNINSPLTSSAGRLFDAAAALLGIAPYASYEAEGPIKLEKISDIDTEASFKPRILKKEGTYIIDFYPVFMEMTSDIKKKKSKKEISSKFHNSVVLAIVNTVKKISKDTKIKDVALSGGVFQNKFLKTKVMIKLVKAGFNVFTNKKVPVNDLNISLGQYYVSSSTGKS